MACADCGVMFCAVEATTMKNDTILVLVSQAEPAEAQLAMLTKAVANAKIIVENSAEAFEQEAIDATILFNSPAWIALFKKPFAICRNLSCVHLQCESM